MTGQSAIIAVFLTSPLALLGYLLATYKRALEQASDAWWMRAGFGTIFLRFAFTWLAPSLGDNSQVKEGRAKAIAIAARPPPPSAVIFVGSSTFTFWRHLQRDMAATGVSAPCYNAAFGGSWTKHVTSQAHALCFAWKPRVVVYFCGTNDLNIGLSPSMVARGFIDFHRALVVALPSTPVVYVAPTVTPFVQARGEAVVASFEETTHLVSAYAEEACRQRAGSVTVVDPRAAAFVSDRAMYLGDDHHLNDEGHRQLAELLAPAIARALEKG